MNGKCAAKVKSIRNKAPPLQGQLDMEDGGLTICENLLEADKIDFIWF